MPTQNTEKATEPKQHKAVTGILLSGKVHLLKMRGGHWVSRCGSERRVYGLVTGEALTCQKCLQIQSAGGQQ